MDNYKFGNLICSLRESHNLTQKKLADILNLTSFLMNTRYVNTRIKKTIFIFGW